jgi:predicted RecA/RadA family phage recombinase
MSNSKNAQDGNVISVTAGSALTAGQPVVVGRLRGVAVTDIANGAVGPVAIAGVYELPAVNGAAFVTGQPIVWDVSANSGAGYADDASATAATGDLSLGCISMETKTASAAGELVKVKLNVGPNTVA